MSLMTEILSIIASASVITGINWTKGSFVPGGPAATSYKAIAYNGIDTYVAITGSSAAAISTDAITWTNITVLSAVYTDVIYGNNIWVATVASSKPAYSTDGITWVLSTFNAGSVWPTKITFNSNVFVGVGLGTTSGNMANLISTDGINWNYTALPLGQSWASIAYGTTALNPNGIYVAVSNVTSSVAAYSLDGLLWRATSLPSSGWWSKVAYGATVSYPNGVFVAMYTGSGNTCAASTDGINWASKATGYTATYSDVIFISDVSSSKTGFFLISNTTVATGTRCVFSTDLTSWVAGITALTGTWSPVDYGNGVVVATNGTVSAASSDFNTSSTTWTLTTLPSAIVKPAYGTSGWIGVISNAKHYYLSTNGINWSGSMPFVRGNSATFTRGIFSVTPSNPDGIYILVNSQTNALVVSTNGINWLGYTMPGTVAALSDIAFGITASRPTGIFIASFGATNGPCRSTDGFNWTVGGSGTYGSVTHGTPASDPNGVFIGFQTASGTNIGKSTDGFYWTTVTVPSASLLRGIFAKPASDPNGIFVAVNRAVTNSNTAFTSTDGVTWVSRTMSASGTWQNIIFAKPASNPGGLFVTVSSVTGTTGCRSTNGVNWVTCTLPASTGWYDVKFGATTNYPNGAFVASSGTSGNTISALSTDAVTWTLCTLPVTGGYNSIIYGNGTFKFINASATVASGGGVFIPASSDMVNWIGAPLPALTWSKASYLNNTYYLSNNAAVINSTDLVNWSNLVTLPVSLTSFTYSDKLIATTGSARVISSTDNINWYKGAGLATSKTYPSVIYGNDIFVAVSNTAGAAGKDSSVSTDGINWTLGTLPVSAIWTSVVYGDGKFVAIPNTSGTDSASSTDGINWTLGTLPITSTWLNITYGVNGFLATSNTKSTALSTDGIVWTLGTLPTTTVNSTSYPVSFVGSEYVAMPGTASGIIHTSSDAISWTNTAIAGNNKLVVNRVGDYFFVFSNVIVDTIPISTNGVNWLITLLPVSAQWYTAAYDGIGNYVILPYSGNKALYSTDAINWVSSNLTESLNWRKVIYAEGRFLAIAQGSVAINISTNGAIWSSYTLKSTTDAYSGIIDNGSGILVCTNVTATASVQAAYSLDNGVSWTPTTLPAANTWVGSAYGFGKYVVLSTTGQAYYSTDSITWAQLVMVTDGITGWSDISFDGNRFIAIATHATLKTTWMFSDDGVNWEKPTPAVSGVPGGATSIDYDQANGIYGAITAVNSRTTSKSTDGINWSSSASYAANLYITDIKSNNNGMWLATSRNFTNVLVTNDPGSTWTPSTLPFNVLCAPGYGNGKFVCFSSPSKYASTTDGANWTLSIPSTAATNTFKICQSGKTISVQDSYSSVMNNTTSMWVFSTLPYGQSWSGVLGNGTNTLLTYASNQYYVYSTNNGTSWTFNTLPTAFGTGLVKMYANGTFYGIASNRGYSSADAINWTLHTVTYNSSGTWSDMAYGTPASNPGGLYVIVAGGTNNGTSTYNVLTSASGGSQSWTPVYDSNGNGVEWAYVAYGNGMFVKSTTGITNPGRVSVSTNGVNWTMSNFSASGQTYGVRFAGGTINKFLLKRPGGVYSSTDGVTWISSTTTTSTTGTPNFSYDSVNNIIVADDPTGAEKIYYSTDAVNWKSVRPNSALTPTSIAYGNGLYVTAYQNSDSVTYSTDAFSWTIATMPISTTWFSIAYGNGEFKAIGDNRIASSTNAINWTLTTAPVTQITYSWAGIMNTRGSQWCAVSSASASNTALSIHSTDGISWTQTTFDNASVGASAMCTTGKYVIVTKGTTSIYITGVTGKYWIKPSLPAAGAYAIASNNSKKSVVIYNTAGASAAAFSTDGANWSTVNLGIGATWNSISYTNNKFIALSSTVNSSISTDGVAWTIGTIPTSSSWSSAAYGLIGATPTYVIVSKTASTTLYTSTNAVNWVQRTLPNSVALNKVSYINNRFVAVGTSAAVYYSTDAITWQASGLNTAGTWRTLAYNGNGRYVAIAGSGTASTVANYSTNGIFWAPVTMASSSLWGDVAVNTSDNSFLAIGGMTTAGTVVNKSTNGINWSLATLPNSSQWSSVAYGSGNFVAVSGWAGQSTYSASSTNGVIWAAAAMPSSNKWVSIAYGNGKFIAVANDSYEAAEVII